MSPLRSTARGLALGLTLVLSVACKGEVSAPADPSFAPLPQAKDSIDKSPEPVSAATLSASGHRWVSRA